MSHNVSSGSSQSQETSSSGYRTQEEVIKTSRSPSSSSVRKPGDMTSEREKLKEELLRQYEAGQLKASVPTVLAGGHPGVSGGHHHHPVPTILSGNSNHPRQIPTIEEYRQTAAMGGVVQFRKPVAISAPLPSSLHLPDLSRPPPGYIYSSQQTAASSLNQAQTINHANYEETIVNRVLQTIMNNAKPQDSSYEHSSCIMDKVLNWDTSGGSGNLESRTPAHLSPARSRSREYHRHQRRSRSPPPPHSERNYRRRSLSRTPERRYVSPRLRDSSRDRFLSPPRLSFHYRSRSRSRSRSRERDRLNARVSRRDISPRTRRYEYPGSPVPRHSSPRRSESRREYTSPRRIQDEGRRRSYDSSRNSDSYHRQRSPRGTCSRYPERSPRSRKIILLSPKKEGRHRDKYGDERGKGSSRTRSRSPVKRRVKDRLGVRNEPLSEVFNMDSQIGRCGAVAIVKEYIDDRNGLLELRTTEGGHGSLILFNESQVWISNRKVDSNGPPLLYTDSPTLPLQKLFPLGQEVLVNARKVRSDLVSLQATVVWPKFTEIPTYKLKPSKLDEDLAFFLHECTVDKLVPVCVNGLPPVGSLNIWSAKIKEIVNEEFGIVELTSDPRDGKREFCHKFKCFFHKSDLWVEDGVRVGDNEFYNQKPLSQLVSLMQPVDLVSRSIIREKGQFMKKSTSSTLEMQALCVSLKTYVIPKGAPRGSRIGGGPGAFGGCNRGETPYMFKIGLADKLNVTLHHFLKVYNKTCSNLDPELMLEKCPPVSHPEVSKKRVHKITDDLNLSLNPSIDIENNNVIQKTTLAETVSNVIAVVLEPPSSDGFGILQSCQRDWNCLFKISDCVLCDTPGELKVGTRVNINANLVDKGLKVQYIASSVWKKSDRSLTLPNITTKTMISAEKLDKLMAINSLYVNAEKNRKFPRILSSQTGIIIKVLDDNFGIIAQDDRFVLFDTCDFRVDEDVTAAKSELKLQEIVTIGDIVHYHAALVNSEQKIPYLATAVWKGEMDSQKKFPAPLSFEQIHPDKINIFKTVCLSVPEDLSSLRMSAETTMLKCKLTNVSGIVKVGIHFHKAASLEAGVVELAGDGNKKIKALFVNSVCLETHEKHRVCTPGTRVTFSAIPVSCDNSPLTHVVTVISSVHDTLPACRDPARVMAQMLELLSQLKTSLKSLEKTQLGVVCYSINKSDDYVVDSVPTGRLVCMVNESSGILEDHKRELAYFEVSDLNLPSSLTLKDVVLVMSRCRDVAVRFQASPVLNGPVKMVVHDGTVTIGSNIDKYYPDIKLSPARVNLKPNSFSPDKLLRAYEAVESYVEDKILSLDRIVESSKFSSKLYKSRRRSQSNDVQPSPKRTTKDEIKRIESLAKVSGRLKTILNENFGLIEFTDESGEKCYCLFDTFDLYLDIKKTAAKRKVTIDKVLTDGEELVFNACKVQTTSRVPWLANGVWKPSLENTPEPVPYEEISKEKLAVFEKVADTCSVMIASWSSLGTNKSIPLLTRQSSSCQILNDNLATIVKTEDTESDNVEPNNDQEMERIIGAKLSQIKNESVNGFEMAKGPSNLNEECHQEPNENDLDVVIEVEMSSLTVTVVNPAEPESAILSFCSSDGSQVRALCHFTRVWLWDRPLCALTQDWDSIVEDASNSVTIKASKVTDCQDFDYQVRKGGHDDSTASDDTGAGEESEQLLANFKRNLSDEELLKSQLHEFRSNVTS